MKQATVAALMKALLPVLGVHHLLVCSPGVKDLDDAFLEHGSDFFGVWKEVYLGIGELVNTELLAKYINDGKRIGIFCTDFPMDGVQVISQLGLGENMYWLTDVAQSANAELRLDSNWITFTENSGQVILDELYRVKGGSVRSFRLGVWKEGKGFIGQWPPPFIWERRSNLSGVTLVDTTISYSWAPLYIHEGVPRGGGSSRGFYPSIRESLKKELDFDFVVTQPKDDRHGALARDVNGSLYWSGMIGQLSRNEVDMSFSGLTVTAERATASDFTLAVLLDPFTVGIRNPEVFDPPSTRINMDVYVSVFTRELWLSCLGLGIITSLVHWFVCTLSHAGRFEANQKHVETIIQSIIFFLSSLALIGQTESGSKKRESQTLSYKTLLLSTFIITYQLFQFYAGNITSYMTSVSEPILMESLRELEDSHYTLWVRKGTSQEAYLSSQMSAKGLSLLEAKIKKFSFSYSPVGLVTSDKHNAIYGSIFSNIDNKIKYLTRDFDGMVKTYLSVALRKDSELRSLFSHQILKLIQSGALHHLRRRWIDRGSPGDASRRIFHQDSFPLGFDNLFFPALVILSGFAGAAMVLLGEKCRRRIPR